MNLRIFVQAILLLLFSFRVFGQEVQIYAVDIGPNRQPPWQVLKYDENGQNPEVFINSALSRPQEVVFLEEDGTVLVSNLGSGRITLYDATTGAFIRNWANNIGSPTRIKIGSDNLLYVLQWAGNGRVLRYDLQGNFVDEFTTTGVSNSIGMDWDSQGNLYVASFDAKNVRKFDSDGNDLGLFINSNLQGPTNIWFVENGDLMVMDWSGGAIRRFNSSGVFQGNFVTGLSEPEGVDFLDNGNFIIGNGGTSSIREYDQNGVFIKDLVSPGAGGLVKPNGVRVRRLSTVTINAGHNDAWVSTDAPFQGMFVTVFPGLQLVFVAWFTFDSEVPTGDPAAVFGADDQRWVTGLGSIEGNRVALNMELTTGGSFNSSTPTPIQDTAYGTMDMEFLSCTEIKLTYSFPGPGLSGMMTMNRVVDSNVDLCETLNAP